jgi:DNA-binding MarR family transcriptional regulator
MTESTSSLLGKFVTLLESEAEQLLRAQLGISYRRMLFLFVLQHQESITQHRLAQYLGYSDPAVSTMLRELVKEGYVTTTLDPDHGRKHLVRITSRGLELARKGRHLLDTHFDELVQLAEVDDQQLQHMTRRLLAALAVKTQKEQS